jgi:hypothetical protein
MNTPGQLVQRLYGIASALAESGSARALLAFGSAGYDLSRLDDYSDLDFLVIAKDGKKQTLLEDLSWLERSSPLVFFYRHTPDGIKALTADGILYDLGIIETGELTRFPHEKGRVVWSEDSFEPSLAGETLSRFPETASERSLEWIQGEIIGALFTGLCRHGRGEKMSAFKLIQGTALERYLELISRLESGDSVCQADPFDPARRVEVRYPGIERELENFAQGYGGTIASAEELIHALSKRVPLDPAVFSLLTSLIAAERLS